MYLLIIWIGICIVGWFITLMSVLNNKLKNDEGLILAFTILCACGMMWAFGCGTIKEEMYYYYYVKGDYGYMIEKIKAKNVEIVEREDEEQKANIITYKKMLVKENNWFAFGKEIFEQTYKIAMYAPKGSVKITYNVSL